MGGTGAWCPVSVRTELDYKTPGELGSRSWRIGVRKTPHTCGVGDAVSKSSSGPITDQSLCQQPPHLCLRKSWVPCRWVLVLP